MDLSSEQRVKLNIGGTMFETTIGTLTNISVYFQGLFNGKFKGYFDEKGNQSEIIFIDRDPDIFCEVLRLMRNPQYTFPSKYVSELEFYGISYSRENDKDSDEDCDEIIKMKQKSKVWEWKLNNSICLAEKCGNPSEHYHHTKVMKSSPKSLEDGTFCCREISQFCHIHCQCKLQPEVKLSHQMLTPCIRCRKFMEKNK